MYLTRRVYVGNQNRENGKKVKISIPRDQTGVFAPITRLDQNKVKSINMEVAYWRKANAIHQWFVNNVQDGVDDCKEYYVTREQLAQLVQECKEDMEYLDTCPKVENEVAGYGQTWTETVYEADESQLNLTPQSGFFFGSTELDEGFYQDLKDTVEMITPELEDEESMWDDYYYQSSW